MHEETQPQHCNKKHAPFCSITARAEMNESLSFPQKVDSSWQEDTMTALVQGDSLIAFFKSCVILFRCLNSTCSYMIKSGTTFPGAREKAV